MTGATAIERPEPMFVRSFEYPAGYTGYFHSHGLGQIVFPVRGLVSVDVGSQFLSVAPSRAVVVPPWERHRVSAQGNAFVRSVFFDATIRSIGSSDVSVIGVNPLLHQLVGKAGEYSDQKAGVSGTAAEIHAQVLSLVCALVNEATVVAAHIELPRVTHFRLSAAFEESEYGEPPWRLSAKQMADQLALSPRQFRRLFKQDTSVSFQTWRSLARVKRAAEKLASGCAVTTLAADLGLSSSSALSELFKRFTGVSPTEFVRLTAEVERQ